MNDPFERASEKQMLAIKQAQAEFRESWSRIRQPPFAAEFSGDPQDIDALDFLDYEGIGYPTCGLEGAAIVWGEVLRKAVGLQWVVSTRGDFMLANVCVYPRMLVWPFARLFELRHRSTPQFGKYGWAMEQVVVECLLDGVPDDVKPHLFGLISPEYEGYVQQISDREDIVEALRALYRPPQDRSGKP